MFNILVTGGAGYIGSHTVDALINAGLNVVIVDDMSTGFKELIHPKAKFFNLNILDTKALSQVMISEKIKAVIHFAAKISVPESVKSPLDYYHNNTFGVIATLEACKFANVKNFVFSSTAAVYGDAPADVVDETTPTKPIHPYGFSKFFSEQIIKDTEADFGLRSVILRYFNVAGASIDLRFGQRMSNASHLIKVAVEAACGKRESMSITGIDYPTFDGTGIRDFIHVQDLAEIHVLAVNYLLGGGNSDIFNCGYGHGFSVRQVINCVKKVSGVNFKVLEADRRPGDIVSLSANSSKLKNKLKWVPKFDNLEVICKSAYQYEKSL